MGRVNDCINHGKDRQRVCMIGKFIVKLTENYFYSCLFLAVREGYKKKMFLAHNVY